VDDSIFRTLTDLYFGNVSGVFSASSALSPNCQYLFNQGYLEHVKYRTTTNTDCEHYTLEITETGLLVLLQDRLRLIKVLVESGLLQVAMAFILNLKEEELPAFLTSNSMRVLFAAKVRLDELSKKKCEII